MILDPGLLELIYRLLAHVPTWHPHWWHCFLVVCGG